MSLLKIFWGTFGTWIKAFNGPCLWACLAAAGLGGWGAGVLTFKIQDARVARSDAALANFRAEMTANTAATVAAQAAMQADATKTLLASMASAVDVLSGQIALDNDRAALAALNNSVKELHNDIRYACRALPLPDPYLDSLRLPRQ